MATADRSTVLKRTPPNKGWPCSRSKEGLQATRARRQVRVVDLGGISREDHLRPLADAGEIVVIVAGSRFWASSTTTKELVKVRPRRNVTDSRVT